MVHIVLRDGEHHPRAEHGGEAEGVDDDHRQQQEPGGGAQPARGIVLLKVHIHTPQEAHGNGAHKQQAVGNIGHSPAAGKLHAVDEEGNGFQNAAGQGNVDHGVIQPVAYLPLLHAPDPGGPEQQHEQHADSVDDQNFLNINSFHPGLLSVVLSTG